MQTKPTGNWEFPIAMLATAVIVGTMAVSAALAMKAQPESTPSGESLEQRARGTADPGIASDAKPDDVQTYY